jgi:hypothetical protein
MTVRRAEMLRSELPDRSGLRVLTVLSVRRVLSAPRDLLADRAPNTLMT